MIAISKNGFVDCIDKTKIHIDNIDKSWRVYLWESCDYLDSKFDETGVAACHSPMPYFYKVDEYGNFVKSRTSPVMGELHFVSKNWDIEVVSHECCHAMFAYLSSHGVFDYRTKMEVEEVYCYLLGDLTRKVYLWLYNKDTDYN